MSTPGMRVYRWVAVVSVVLLAGCGAWMGWMLHKAGRDREALHGALADVQRGRFERAMPVLERLAPRFPDDDRIPLAIALCQRAEGRIDQAVGTLRSIAPGSQAARQAAAELVDMAQETGRWSIVHDLKASDLPETGQDAERAFETLIFILRSQGRTTEALAVLRGWFARAADRPGVLKRLWAIDSDPFPVEGVSAILDDAERRAGVDADLALARANLCLELGDVEDARRRAADCLAQRPDDAVVLNLALRIAVATGDAAQAAEITRRLPADALEPRDALRAAARLAQTIDAEREEHAWQALLTLDPTDAEALDRLAELCAARNAPAAAELRRRKAQRDTAQRAYEGRLNEDQPEAAAEELATLATQLGRSFDARGWLTIAAQHQPSPRITAAIQSLAATKQSDSRSAVRTQLLQAAAELAERSVKANAHTAQDVALPAFNEAAVDAGLQFRFENGATPAKQLPETMSGGVALFDFDNDGWLDLYAVQGGTFPPPEGARCADRVYHNRGDGTFEDVSESMNIAAMPGGYGHGVTVGDVNNDGFADVFVTRFGSYALYLNEGGRGFADATAAWGLDVPRDWPTSAALADLDNDGDLDLYVCHYVAWDAAKPHACTTGRGVTTYCPPAALGACCDRLYRNDGGRFVDVTKDSGVEAADRDGRGLGVVAADLDDDGRIDLFVANDTTANYFFRNLGNMRFEEQAQSAGLAANASGGYLAGMGVAIGDLDGDQRVDLAVTNFYGESTTLYKAVAAGQYVDGTSAIGLDRATRHRLGFGIAFADVNNDSILDVIQSNGHVDDYRPAYAYAMPAQLLVADGRGRLFEPASASTSPWSTPHIGRGLAVGDLDNDGRIDVVLVDQQGPVVCLKNTTPEAGHYLMLTLRGTRSNRDAVGARIIIGSAARRQMRLRYGGGSYQSSNDPRLHFGTGEAATIDSIEIHWPSGAVDRHTAVAADSAYVAVEAAERLAPDPGFARN